MILCIDNYDSFVFNLVQYFRQLGHDVQVFRNDELTIDQVENLNPDAIMLSPGPGRPEDAGICIELVRQLSGQIPILGVCLGHQAIAMAFGAEVVKARRVMHGFPSPIHHREEGITLGLENPFPAMRYHSLLVDKPSITPPLRSIAETQHGECMILRVEDQPTWGIQFHPESVMTPLGHQLLDAFLREAGIPHSRSALAGIAPPVRDADWPRAAMRAYQSCTGYNETP
jgi:4-amino-4-deoxychorismate synthase (2-amino-4-deoxychorismate-forming) component II